MAYFEEHNLSCIWISPYHGFHAQDLRFLKDSPSIRGVSLSDASNIDIDGLQFLENNLELLGIVNNRQPLDLARFPRLEEFRAEWHPGIRISSDCRKLQILDLSKYKPKNKDLSE
ncbi:MAG: hypothetical protein DWQ01_07630 [Planctomycetota bacterium]|nr:MAG: hypothetical protein DWQ01_07630 [Planctomycetota bacterium]